MVTVFSVDFSKTPPEPERVRELNYNQSKIKNEMVKRMNEKLDTKVFLMLDDQLPRQVVNTNLVNVDIAVDQERQRADEIQKLADAEKARADSA